MAYKLYTELAHSSNHGATRKTSDIKFLVLHYTANKTDTAKANANYFKTANRKASAHMFVDSTSVYQSVKDNVIAWAVGGSKYSDCAKTGGGKLYGKVTNANSISIEMCSTNGEFAHDTLTNAVLLVRKLMKKYDIDIDHVITHHQITGKYCPKYWMGSKENEAKFIAFKNRVVGKKVATTVDVKKDDADEVEKMNVKTSGDDLNCHKTKDMDSDVVGKFENGKLVKVLEKTSSTVYKVKAHDTKDKEIVGYVSAKYLV